MAKPFSETVNIQPQTIATGAPQAMMSLSEKLNEFSSFTAGLTAKKVIASASAKGAAAFTPGEKPEFKKQSFIGGVATKAYNSSLRSSYVASVDRDLNLKLNALKDIHGEDLVSFNDAANAQIKGTIEGVDPASRDLILQSANNFMDSARVDVQTATITKTMEESDEEQALSSEYYGSEADRFAFSGDNLSSVESLNKVLASNQARLDAGRISTSQLAVLNDDAIQSTKIATNRGELSRVLQLPNGVQLAAGAISQVIATPIKGMTPEQNDELVKTLNSDLGRFITLQNRQEVADQASLTVRQNNNYSQLLLGMAEGELNQTQLNNAVRKGDISGGQFDKMTQKLSSQGVGVTDINLQLGIQMSIAEGIDETAAIVENMGVNLTTADAGVLLKMQQEYANGESVLNSNNSKRARSFMTQSMKVTGLLGQLTDGASRKTASAILEFDQRVLDGEDAMSVANDLYDRDTLLKAESRAGNQGHNTADISAAITANTDNFRVAYAAAKGANDPNQMQSLANQYNRDTNALKLIRDLQISQKQFDESLKRVQ